MSHKTLTIHQVAQMAGVSVRTLHHYDHLGLLEPEGREENGYRLYGYQQLERLQQILFFKELDFSLERIKELLDAPNFDRVQAYKDQYAWLNVKRQRLDGLLKNLDQKINSTEDTMSDTDISQLFNTDQEDAYKREAQLRWGQTDAWKQSQERTKNWTKDDYARIKQQNEDLNRRLAAAMDRSVIDPQVQALVAEHRAGIHQFYDCSDEMYAGLAQMYVEDPRFTKTYDQYRPGLAQFLHDAILESMSSQH